MITEEHARDITRAIVWKIAQDEGGHILHYNGWIDDNWEVWMDKYDKGNRKIN